MGKVGRPKVSRERCRVCGLSYDKVRAYTVLGERQAQCLPCRAEYKRNRRRLQKQQSAVSDLSQSNQEAIANLTPDRRVALTRMGKIVRGAYLEVTAEKITISDGYYSYELEVDLANIARWLANKLLKVSSVEPVAGVRPLVPKTSMVESIMSPSVNSEVAQRFLDWGYHRCREAIRRSNLSKLVNDKS